jgi:lipid II:glycine glycyltransferase (peptidoglycan interpeptide bridge formation enzyme)
MDFSNFINVRQTSGFAKFLEFFHWKAIHHQENIFYYVRRVPLLGSIIKIEKINLQNINLKEIDDLAKREKACFVKIEPFKDDSKQKELDEMFFKFGYSHDSWPLTSTSSYIIDLDQSLEKIIANFKIKFRYNLRLAIGKNNLVVKIVNGDQLVSDCHSCESRNLISDSLLYRFSEIYNSRAREIKSEQHSFEELKHMCESFGEKLWMIYVEYPKIEILSPCHSRATVLVWRKSGNPENKILDPRLRGDDSARAVSNSSMIMASMFLQTKDIFHYWHNGSTKEGRSLFAPTLVIVEGIKLGQKLGCKMFEFEGIYDERFKDQTKRWKGFTKFKEGFNGEKVIYTWPYIKFYSPVFKFFHFLKMI